MSDHLPKPPRHRLWASALVGSILVGGVLFWACSCGGPTPHKVTTVEVPVPGPPPPAVTCDGGESVGSTRDGPGCPTGEIGKVTEVCTDTGWKTAANSCVTPPAPTCAKTLFAEVQPILRTYCAGCHVSPGDITTFTVASSWKNEIGRRIVAPPANNDHMPKGTATQLPDPSKALLSKWVGDGGYQTCPTAETPTFYDLKYIDGVMVNDLIHQSASDSHFIRYLVTADAMDAGVTGEALAAYEHAINKGVNGLNNELDDLFPVAKVDAAGTVWRIDLRSYGIGPAEIAVIEAADKDLNFIDNTNQGQILQALTGTRKPWFNADNFLNITNRNSDVYYRVLNLPATIKELTDGLGVDVNADLANLTATFIGSNASSIAENKNRLLVRFPVTRTQDAYYWQSFDINNIPGNADPKKDKKSLQAFPLLAGTGGVHNFQSDASESIFSLRNGLQAYFLSDGAGKRLNVAALNVVRDNRTPIGDGSIITSISCQGCHNAGIIPMQDVIAAHVKANADQFGTDAQIVARLYISNNGTFIHDNTTLAKAFAKIGIDPLKADPISEVTNRFLLNYDLTWAASKLFLTPAQLTDAINASAQAKAQIGALLTGGNVTSTQFFAVLPQLIKDAGLFLEPVGQ
jgi:hypothetical protein